MHGTPFFTYLTEFATWIERLGYAKGTIISYTRQLRSFFNWLLLHHINDIVAINQSILENYNHYLHTRINQLFGGGLSTSSIQSHLNVIRLFDQYIQHVYHQQILHGLLVVTHTAPTPRSILTQAEVKLLYNATDQSVVGYRDRAILALYYGCGLRRSEGTAIQLNHIHYNQCLLQVVPGKTKQNRYVPMSNHVWQHLQDYQHYSRPYLVGALSNNYLILNSKGSPVHPNNMGCYFKQLLAKTTITKEISLHHLRHSIASHLLQSGMPLEQISRFLGHKQLNSTQIYTRIAEEMNHG